MISIKQKENGAPKSPKDLDVVDYAGGVVEEGSGAPMFVLTQSI